MSEQDPQLLDGAIAPAANTRLLGHEQAQEFLARSYRTGKSHHAILIEGPEGIGKATLAFRFANYVLSNPEPGLAPVEIPDPDPTTPISRQILSGASHNLLHLTRPVDDKTGKVKSAITVDEVRRAGHFFSQTSGTGNRRIVVIDPADDLNRNAANAILKILEEPPRGAMFLVLSHAPGKLLPTIRSRCQTLKLSPLGDAELKQALSMLGQRLDGGQTEETVLSLAKGSVARALKLMNYGGLDIMAAFDEVVRSEGPSARRAMHRLADVLSGKDSEVIFTFFLEHLTEYLAEQARTAALDGQLPLAEKRARMVSEIGEKITISTAYNLDKKQTLLSILEAARAA
ncbi:DNA polymerase-3 subunit delta' [Rhizobium sp. NFR07]|uniref:DNA polymerase III subunit delta' n=1 Tax=Rhizobium sp. NFR07 TaxID=1566262 RepID=UPI0008E2A780|nr:DNA polymerase III subunit delta' [Rhizobium sp. NFR07]SFB36583.1 DNA polymerase-3 subunit delta' [Rhizobium sp. NFR07]